MRTVKVNGVKPKEPPTPVAKAEIEGQGSIPYAVAKEEKTPDTMYAKITRGKARGMGAAERGGKFTIA
jgi:hypothetical protein